MRFHPVKLFLLAICCCYFSFMGSVSASSNWIQDKHTIDEAEKKLVIEQVEETLKRNHFSPKVAAKICSELANRKSKEEVGKVSDCYELTRFLNRKFLEIGKDLHLTIQYTPTVQSKVNVYDPKENLEARLRILRKDNFGFKETAILDGNVGYLRLDVFPDPQLCQKKLEASMKVLEDTDAMIIDLRNNNGGSLETVQLLCSYFWPHDPQEQLVNYFYVEKGKRFDREMWTLASIAGKRRPEVPLYVLTSNSSFSAAEWMTLILKSRGRAKVIGGTTAGGAHPVTLFAVGERFKINIPIGRIVDVKSLFDFESKGVTPDVLESYSKSKVRGHLMALESLHKDSQISTSRYQWIRSKLNSELNPTVLSPDQLQLFVGTYGSRKFWIESGKLFYSFRGKGRYQMIPTGKTSFLIRELDNFRFEFRTEDSNVTGIYRVDRNGSRSLYDKDSD